jgi:hypothetical protein
MLPTTKWTEYLQFCVRTPIGSLTKSVDSVAMPFSVLRERTEGFPCLACGGSVPFYGGTQCDISPSLSTMQLV